MPIQVARSDGRSFCFYIFAIRASTVIWDLPGRLCGELAAAAQSGSGASLTLAGRNLPGVRTAPLRGYTSAMDCRIIAGTLAQLRPQDLWPEWRVIDLQERVGMIGSVSP